MTTLRSEDCQPLCFPALGLRKFKPQRMVLQLFRLPMVSWRFVLVLPGQGCIYEVVKDFWNEALRLGSELNKEISQ